MTQFKAVWCGNYDAGARVIKRLKEKGIYAWISVGEMCTETLTAGQLGTVISAIIFAGVWNGYWVTYYRDNENESWRVIR